MNSFYWWLVVLLILIINALVGWKVIDHKRGELNSLSLGGYPTISSLLSGEEWLPPPVKVFFCVFFWLVFLSPINTMINEEKKQKERGD